MESGNTLARLQTIPWSSVTVGDPWAAVPQTSARQPRTGLAWADVRAVSYTHLDVYKRQLRERAHRLVIDLEELPTTGSFDRPDTLGRQESLGCLAVSYTHLDVYKRQPSGRLASR